MLIGTVMFNQNAAPRTLYLCLEVIPMRTVNDHTVTYIWDNLEFIPKNTQAPKRHSWNFAPYIFPF